MKLVKYLIAGAFALAAPSAMAFHSGGVAECEGCHSMHNSFEGAANVTGMPQFQSGPYLLKAQDQAGACLNCHNSPDSVGTGYHISTDQSILGLGAGLNGNPSGAPVEYKPGGDFAWLKMTTNGAIRGTPTTWEGDRHGHNIVAVDYGYTQDKIQTVAPGGTYPASALACSSCHDPHGRYRRDAAGNQGTPNGITNSGQVITAVNLPIFGSGSYGNGTATQGGPAYPNGTVSAAGVYRLLAGIGYQPKSLSGSFAFANPSPDAVVPSSYDKVETSNSDPTQQVVVAYGRGMSEWCANCHTAMLQNSYVSGMKGLTHPAGNNAHLTATIASNYNAYVSSGVLTATGTNYSNLAPFENGVSDSTYATYTSLKTKTTAPDAADTTKNVACVTCHRAHATAFESGTRFYTGNEFMTVATSAGVAAYDASTTENKINTGYTVAQQTAAYYGRPATVFGPYARDYCNKCHAKD